MALTLSVCAFVTHKRFNITGIYWTILWKIASLEGEWWTEGFWLLFCATFTKVKLSILWLTSWRIFTIFFCIFESAEHGFWMQQPQGNVRNTNLAAKNCILVTIHYDMFVITNKRKKMKIYIENSHALSLLKKEWCTFFHIHFTRVFSSRYFHTNNSLFTKKSRLIGASHICY